MAPSESSGRVGQDARVTTGADRASLQSTRRPARSDPYGDKSWNNHLNPAAFAQPAFGTFGNATRNG
jgi:hypothetical protein